MVDANNNSTVKSKFGNERGHNHHLNSTQH